MKTIDELFPQQLTMIERNEESLRQLEKAVPIAIELEGQKLMGFVHTAAEAIEKVAEEISNLQKQINEKNDTIDQTQQILGQKITDQVSSLKMALESDMQNKVTNLQQLI